MAALGYTVTASDISDGELAEAAERAKKNGVKIRFEHADFCALSDTFSEQFDIVIAMDNALPHMLTSEALEAAIKSIAGQVGPGGIFVASIRDYDRMLQETGRTDLLPLCRERIGFYSCTVPAFEQYVLTDLLDSGDFERHIRRVRRRLRETRV